MQTVIAIRHGDYDRWGSGGLTHEGREDVLKLARAIKSEIDRSRAMLMSSPTRRTIETSEIIRDVLGLADFVQCEDLGKGTFYHGKKQVDAILGQSGVADTDVVIAVTHSESPSGILHVFSERYFDKEVAQSEIEKGTGLCLDLRTGEITQLP